LILPSLRTAAPPRIFFRFFTIFSTALAAWDRGHRRFHIHANTRRIEDG
jgi:hypothetical protein